MAKYLGRGPIGYDQRTDKKVRYRQLVEDGEIPGLYTTKAEADVEHPQKFLRRVGPDKQTVWLPAPDTVISPAEVLIGTYPDGLALGSGNLLTPALPISLGGIVVTVG